jgi:hypothetical protein
MYIFWFSDWFEYLSWAPFPPNHRQRNLSTYGSAHVASCADADFLRISDCKSGGFSLAVSRSLLSRWPRRLDGPA